MQMYPPDQGLRSATQVTVRIWRPVLDVFRLTTDICTAPQKHVADAASLLLQPSFESLARGKLDRSSEVMMSAHLLSRMCSKNSVQGRLIIEGCRSCYFVGEA